MVIWGENKIDSFLTEVAFGRIDGYLIVNKFGRNPDIDTGSVPEDIWQGSGLYTGQDITTAETVDIESSSAADTAAGTGAQSLFISGLDGDYVEMNEIIALNGTTAVTSVNSYLRLNRAYIMEVGSGGVNAGGITIDPTTTGSGARFASVEAGFGQTQIAAYTVPDGYEALVTKIYGIMRRGGGGTWQREAALNFMTRATGEGWRSRRPTSVSPSSTTVVNLDGGILLAARTDMILRVDAVSHSNSEVAGGFDVLLRRLAG